MAKSVQVDFLFTHLEAMEILSYAMDTILASDRANSVSMSDIIKSVANPMHEEVKRREIVLTESAPPWAQTNIQRKYRK